MNPTTAVQTRTRYEHELRTQILPFWLRHAIDREHGGYFAGLDRTGVVIETDKSVWFQGRFAWLLASLHTRLEPSQEWLDLARHGIDFLERHCFGDDGRMYFRVDRTGRPLIKRRRYVFSECFAIMAMSAYAHASGEARYVDRARELLHMVERFTSTPDLLDPKVDQRTRPTRGFTLPMIMIAVLQELRRADPGRRAEYTRKIDGCITELRCFMKPEYKAVMEQIDESGEIQDHLEGRLLNPGHAIEGAWFVLKEAVYRDRDPDLVSIGTTILDWMWTWGWDTDHGGILYYRDVLNHPPTEYWHDMKFWWPQCEAIIATLWAYALTGDDRYERMYAQCDEWTHARFPDREHGEWFGYLHRDGSVSSEVKGSMFKGPFHIPRMYLEAIDALGAIAAG